MRDPVKKLRSDIRSGLRRIWLRSSHRSSAMTRGKYTCVKCGAKQSKKKGKEVKCEVHHKNGITNWDAMIDSIMENLFCDIDDLEILCKPCHDGVTYSSSFIPRTKTSEDNSTNVPKYLQEKYGVS